MTGPFTVNIMDIECGGLTFTSDFDSSNIAKVEFVPIEKNRKKIPYIVAFKN